MKKILSRLGMFVLILSMTLGFCGRPVFAYSEDEVKQITQYYFQSWNQTDFQEYIDRGVITGEALLEQYTGWQEIKGQIGEFKEAGDIQVEEAGDTVVVTQAGIYENGSVNFTVTFDKAMAEQDAASAVVSIDAKLPDGNAGGASMAKAGMNTLMGMGIVFLALIFISLVISLLKYVPALFEKMKKNETEPEALSADSVSAPMVEENVTDDTELVAVITAAIMALWAEEGHGDGSGFTVRSIRRRRG